MSIQVRHRQISTLPSLRSRGFALLTVLAIIVLGVFLMAAVAQMVGSQSRAQRLAGDRRLAKVYAENGVVATLARLHQDLHYGKNGETLELPALGSDPKSAGATVDFSPHARFRSTNNAENDERVDGSTGNMLPPHSVHVVSQGRYGLATVYQEVLLSAPPYPYALVSSGPLSTHGAFLLGSLEDPSALDHGIDSLEFQKALRPGSLASNSPAKPAINLQGAPVRITGNAVSVGTIALAPGVELEGLKEEGHKPVGLPEINLKDLDPSARSVLLSLSEGVIEGRREIKGFARRQGDLRIEGDLVLKEGLLYVDGNLTVTGKISGLGCLVVTGTSHFSQVSLASLEQLALLSRGDLTIQGPGRERSTLVGLLYSEGNLTLSGVTVVGAVVCAGSTESSLTLTDVTALTSPKGVEFEIFESFVKLQSDPILVGGGGMGTARDVVVRLKSVSDPNSPDGKRDARPADFAPPQTFDPGQHLEVWDPKNDEVVTSLRATDIKGGQGFLADIDKQIPVEPSQSDVLVSSGRINLDLNRFLKLSDKLKVVFREVHYGSPRVAGSTS